MSRNQPAVSRSLHSSAPELLSRDEKRTSSHSISLSDYKLLLLLVFSLLVFCLFHFNIFLLLSFYMNSLTVYNNGIGRGKNLFCIRDLWWPCLPGALLCIHTCLYLSIFYISLCFISHLIPPSTAAETETETERRRRILCQLIQARSSSSSCTGRETFEIPKGGGD